jgi:uncharacterized Zn-binding protein involved in type VI secretion
MAWEAVKVSFAATVGQQTAHTPLTPRPPTMGSPNVLIGGKPAWRAGKDSHVCPLSDGSKPHVGGTVRPGSKTVRINGYPAARMGDQVMEKGAPNPITSGVETVLIG